MKTRSHTLFIIALFVLTLFNGLAQNGTWFQRASYGGGGRVQAVSFSIGSKGYIGTGVDANYNPQNDFWEYDPATDTWTQKASLGTVGRSSASGFSIGSKGYIGLGYYNAQANTDFWEYDPTLNTWTSKA